MEYQRRGMNRRQFLRTTAVGAVGLAGAAMMGSSVARAQPVSGGVLERVKTTYGKVKIVLPVDNFYGLSEWRMGSTVVAPFTAGATPHGIEPDFGRALAAAVFDVNENVDDYIEWVNAGGYTPERFTTVSSGAADVGFAVATYTLARDTLYGVDFGPTYFFDGANIWAYSPTVTKLGTIQNTTGVELAMKWAAENGAQYFDYPDQASMVQAYINHEIDGMLTDASGLISAALSSELDGSIILSTPLSKEPLAVIVPEGDEQWADIVRWVMFALFEGEKAGVGAGNVQMSWFSSLGPKLGLSQYWAYNAVKAVGNYKEVYEFNLPEDAWYVPAKPKRGPNDSWKNGGLIYPMQIR